MVLFGGGRNLLQRGSEEKAGLVSSLLGKLSRAAPARAQTELCQVVSHLLFHGVRGGGGLLLGHVPSDLTGAPGRLSSTTRTMSEGGEGTRGAQVAQSGAGQPQGPPQGCRRAEGAGRSLSPRGTAGTQARGGRFQLRMRKLFSLVSTCEAWSWLFAREHPFFGLVWTKPASSGESDLGTPRLLPAGDA